MTKWMAGGALVLSLTAFSGLSAHAAVLLHAYDFSVDASDSVGGLNGTLVGGATVVGGELVPSMLELRLDEGSGVYAAPLQMKANNGILVIDDFGRQLMSPRDLLNRWIVPLDRRVDYLTLRYGVKFQIPFQLMVVFSTNLDPADLADEAFLRRIQNKIYVDPIDEASFDEVFARVTRARKIDAPPGASAYLRQLCMTEGRKELRACYPYDICNLLLAIGRYEGRPPQLTRVDLERAVKLYFAKTTWDGQDLTT